MMGNGGIALDVDENAYVSVVVTSGQMTYRMAIAKDLLPTIDWEQYMQQAVAKVIAP